MKSDNSVWTWSYSKRYYLTHPWSWFKQLRRNIRAAYMRARYGWCYSDVWNWDAWFMNTVPAMFRHLVKYGQAYPGREPFNTFEEWHEWLTKMADQIESCTEKSQTENNEFYEEYMEHLLDRWEPPVKDENGMLHYKGRERTELEEKYFKRCHELSDKARADIKDACNQIGEHFFFIWD